MQYSIYCKHTVYSIQYAVDKIQYTILNTQYTVYNQYLSLTWSSYEFMPRKYNRIFVYIWCIFTQTNRIHIHLAKREGGGG